KFECLLPIGLNQSQIEIVSCLANREHVKREMTPWEQVSFIRYKIEEYKASPGYDSTKGSVVPQVPAKDIVKKLWCGPDAKDTEVETTRLQRNPTLKGAMWPAVIIEDIPPSFDIGSTTDLNNLLKWFFEKNALTVTDLNELYWYLPLRDMMGIFIQYGLDVIQGGKIAKKENLCSKHV
ncbi:MAG: hypothetical protein NXI00_22975, partial [Cytophagales bacterium]|nr:hypothetical protein [Cytophagales bacterium]